MNDSNELSDIINTNVRYVDAYSKIITKDSTKNDKEYFAEQIKNSYKKIFDTVKKSGDEKYFKKHSYVLDIMEERLDKETFAYILNDCVVF